ncbi:MAG: DUF1848 domain-containing protein [Desulfovibrio sp.]|nr:DUF1848 domain-containing protein [Desulfovibrio sp.]
MKWPETVITTPQGQRTAIAPVVISASRATDIPAFHARWFMERLRAGHCLWQNPFNPTQRHYISFEKCAVIVFWSKDPRPLLPSLAEIEASGRRFYFHFTLNDYEREGLEPHVPSLGRRIATFRELSRRYGPERVIWRFDPLILGDSLTVEGLLARVRHLAEELAPHTEKLVFSFLDMYRKARLRLGKHDPSLRPPTPEEMWRLGEGMVRITESLGSPLRLAACAEDPDMLPPVVAQNRCVDPELILRLCPENGEVRRLCGAPGQQAQGSLVEIPAKAAGRGLKDSGQRPACGCAPSKDIGRYSTCPHGCVYCYANGSQAEVLRNLSTAQPGSEGL